jgi:hypothetical protein
MGRCATTGLIATLALVGCGTGRTEIVSAPHRPAHTTFKVPVLSVSTPGHPATASKVAIRRLTDHGCRAVIVIGSRAICKGSPSAVAESERALGVSLK